MSANQDLDRSPEEIEPVAAKFGRALATSFAKNFAERYQAATIEEQRVADYIFRDAAAEVLDRFPVLGELEKFSLRNRTIETVKTAFENRLAELGSGST
jgi:GTP1/Obg family GTP-binding protein